MAGVPPSGDHFHFEIIAFTDGCAPGRAHNVFNDECESRNLMHSTAEEPYIVQKKKKEKKNNKTTYATSSIGELYKTYTCTRIRTKSAKTKKSCWLLLLLLVWLLLHKTEANQKSIEKIYCMDFGCVELSCVALEWHHGSGRCFHLLLPLGLLAAVAEQSVDTTCHGKNISLSLLSNECGGNDGDGSARIKSNRMEWK